MTFRARSSKIYVMPNTPVSSQAFCSYVTGYVDGEGCFSVSFNRRSTLRTGWEVRPSFSVSQNGDRAEVLHLMMDYFQCGSIRPDRSDKTLKYEVRDIRNLIERVIPHFRSYPLLSSKRLDFERFAAVCEQVAKGAHLTVDGFREIRGDRDSDEPRWPAQVHG
jgi:LAGLIDADG endonuclease